MLKKAGRIPEQILGKVSIAVSGAGDGTSGAWLGSATSRGVGMREEENIPRFFSVSFHFSVFLCTW